MMVYTRATREREIDSWLWTNESNLRDGIRFGRPPVNADEGFNENSVACFVTAV